MYEIISYQQTTKWEEKLNKIANRDIFYLPSYSNLYRSMGDGDPHLFYFEDKSGNKLGYVFLKRKIDFLPGVGDETINKELYDIITPSYGYGGPLLEVEDYQLIKQFRREFEEYCQRDNIICEFIRFHPLLQNHKYMENFIDVSYDRETIFIDLSKSEQEIFLQCHKNHKRNINKANKLGLIFQTFTKNDAFEIIEDFYKLYTETMDKLNASQYSYFSIDYIKELLSDLSENSLIGAVFYKGTMIAAAVCLFDGTLLHYHLGCSKKEFLNLGGNPFLLHNLAIWGKKVGLNKFHLGGGHIGRDSLFEFKFRFNSSGLRPFYIGKKIHNTQIYNELVDNWEKYYCEEPKRNFFPAYRNKPKNVVPI